MNFDLVTNAKGRNAAKRYEAEIEKNSNGCWNWTGRKNSLGYGSVKVDTVMGRMLYAHRLMYLLHYGPFDPAKVVRHKCHNPSCVSPAHLDLGTHADNMRDMVEANRQARVSQPGEKNGNSKLVAEDVLKIRADYPGLVERMGKTAAQKELATVYSVDKSLISMIANRKRWTHL